LAVDVERFSPCADCLSGPYPELEKDRMLSLIIPTWNNLPYLKLCLHSVTKHSVLDNQVVIHVNDGSDGTLEWVRENGIEHTHTPTNVGICEAMNIAASKCVADFLVYLNDDMYVLPNWDQLLYERAAEHGDREPRLVSGTMVQANQISPRCVIGDYGATPEAFDEESLLRDYRCGCLDIPDWNGATWPPCCVHRRWWDAVAGYSVEFSPGFYSDIDFSMKLWQLGCRSFCGIGSSLVYHFGERTTSLVRGRGKWKVKSARWLFYQKWGIMPSTFIRYYLRCGEPYQAATAEPQWDRNKLERARLTLLSLFSSRVRFNDKNTSPKVVSKAA
jgi:glycosyltransferase involved in cell wall biosynthesis